MRTFWRLLLTGLGVTAVRIVGQLWLPAGEQTVLLPSRFVAEGTMPLAFSLYGLFAYTLLASLFLLVRGSMAGSGLRRGLGYGLSCCVVWTAYLWEPLPHVAPLDRITYPLADGLALLVMGLLLGLLLPGKIQREAKPRPSLALRPVLLTALCFVAGRLALYLIFHIYSSFEEQPAQTLLWCAGTGLAVGGVMAWLAPCISAKKPLTKALVLGGMLFGLDLTLFNFFMPLVFSADVPDLLLRTAMDTLMATVGCLSLTGEGKAAAMAEG